MQATRLSLQEIEGAGFPERAVHSKSKSIVVNRLGASASETGKRARFNCRNTAPHAFGRAIVASLDEMKGDAVVLMIVYSSYLVLT